MTSQSNDDAPAPIPCVPIAFIQRYQIVGDDTVLFMRSGHGDELALRFRNANLDGLRLKINDALTDARQAAMPKGQTAYEVPQSWAVEPAAKVPQSFAIGSSDQVRNCTSLTFDAGAPGAATFMMDDESALAMCRAISESIGKRNAALRSGIATPRKLILPRGH
jgi:hypothetical protein